MLAGEVPLGGKKGISPIVRRLSTDCWGCLAMLQRQAAAGLLVRFHWGMSTFIGIDPGGKAAFGWCVMEVGGAQSEIKNLKTGTESQVGEVIKAVARQSPGAPIGAGVDAPLFWSRNGERQSDQRIRKAVAKAGGRAATVGHVNSLRGACLVQGILATVALTERWPEILITESHPKALLAVWADARQFVRQHAFHNDHERDAALGAYAALAGWRKLPGWKNWFDVEDNPFVPSCSRVAYWFPMG